MSIKGSMNQKIIKGKISSLRSIDKSLSKEGWAADAKVTGEALDARVKKAEIADDLTTDNPNKVLSARQGMELQKNIEDTASDINELRTTIYKKLEKRIINQNLYGQYDNACILNVNNSGMQASIVGGEDNVLGTYHDRDIVGIYTDIIAPKGIQFESESFTEFTVTAPDTIDISSLKEGMIVDCYNSDYLTPTDKYSGFINRVEGQTIYVNHWYKTNNTSIGQTPTTDYKYIVVNGATKTWLYNGNTSLSEESVAKFAVIGEYGLFNHKSETDPYARVDGIDIVNFAGKSNYGFQIRKASNSGGRIEYGYLSNGARHGYAVKNATYGFLADDSVYNGFVSLNAKTSSFCAGTSHDDYRYKRDGIGRLQINARVVRTVTENASLNTQYDTYLIAGDNTTITIPEPSQILSGRIFELFCIGAITFYCESGMHFPATESGTNYGQSFTSEIKQTLHLICDGANWYLMK